MQIFNKSGIRDKLTIMKELPIAINYQHGQTAMSYFSDGTCSSTGCMRCVSPKCMYFSNNEIHCDSIPDFPADNNNFVCPTAAISLDSKSNFPQIDVTKCIKCGVCLNRCPVGAIYYNGKEIKINLELSDKQNTVPYNPENEKIHNDQINNVIHIKKNGVPIIESDELFYEIYQKLLKEDYRFHNLIARNLLIALGCKCAVRRTGDVYTRMDAFYSSLDSNIGAIEVEFGHDTLDAARGILDDVAVSNTRYSISKEKNLPFVICLQLPNVRQGYWQVVKDVKNVEDIIINTVTIGALIILCWNRCTIIPSEIAYYLDYDNMDLRKVITNQIGREVHISNKLLGIFEPNK